MINVLKEKLITIDTVLLQHLSILHCTLYLVSSLSSKDTSFGVKPGWKKRLVKFYDSIRAFQYSKCLRSGENVNDEIIIDTVTEMSGMEALIVFGVGLDYVRSDNEHKKKSMRCCIYKAITRAHLTFYLIN